MLSTSVEQPCSTAAMCCLLLLPDCYLFTASAARICRCCHASRLCKQVCACSKPEIQTAHSISSLCQHGTQPQRCVCQQVGLHASAFSLEAPAMLPSQASASSHLRADTVSSCRGSPGQLPGRGQHAGPAAAPGRCCAAPGPGSSGRSPGPGGGAAAGEPARTSPPVRLHPQGSALP